MTFRAAERLTLLATDALAVAAAQQLYIAARFDWQWFGETVERVQEGALATAVLVVYWVGVLFFAGLYRERYAASRFEELVSLFKTVVVGFLFLIFAVYIDRLQEGASPNALFFYGGSVFACIALGRVLVRSVQVSLRVRGIGTHKALIVGWSDKVDRLYDEVARYPAAGLDVVGRIRMDRPATGRPTAHQPVAMDARGHALPDASGDGASLGPVLAAEGSATHTAVEVLPDLIDELEVRDVLIALGSEDHDALMRVLQLCDGKPITMKLVPDFYTIIGGMARTEHMYGLPLIEVLPEPMAPWEQIVKRLIDFAAALAVLVVGFPFWIATALVVRLTSRGPAIYRQERTGQNGKPFTIYKFRTMWHDAEARSGPVFAQKDDPRYTPVGRWLRKTRLDEVPQLWNVLKGEMSLVGPRPERPFFVEKLAQEIPLYNRRHRVKPGITGWAQIKWRYAETVEDTRQKVKFDLFYIENMSLEMDLKILLATIRTALRGEGQ